MKGLIRQSIGIDVSQKKLDVAVLGITEDLTINTLFQGTFKNNQEGFLCLSKIVQDKIEIDLPTVWVMEATGVYHEKLAHFLFKSDYSVSIILPNKMSNYMKTLAVKTITDKSCSQAIAQFGLERKVILWRPPNPLFQTLRHLIRERDQIVYERTSVKNQLHSEEQQAHPLKSSIRRLKKRVQLLDRQESEIKKEINGIVSQNEKLKKEISYLVSIPGIGILTAVTLLAETNGFELIENKRQLTSYSGLDIREKISGTSVHGKPRITKKGNRHIRKAMYLPALSAIRTNEKYRNVYSKIVTKNGIKKKGIVAVQRRLLELCYLLHKNKMFFDQEFDKKIAHRSNPYAMQTSIEPSLITLNLEKK